MANENDETTRTIVIGGVDANDSEVDGRINNELLRVLYVFVARI